MANTNTYEPSLTVAAPRGFSNNILVRVDQSLSGRWKHFYINVEQTFRPASCAIADDLPSHVRFLHAPSCHQLLRLLSWIRWSHRPSSQRRSFLYSSKHLAMVRVPSNCQTDNDVSHRLLNTPVAFLRGFHRAGAYSST